MDKESIYELQKIDCNCNDCGCMVRDFDKYQKWENWNKDLQLQEFEKRKAEAFKIAEQCEDEAGKRTLHAYAKRLRFMFDKTICTQYGNCTKFDKPVSFFPGQCLIDTQKCFVHRKDMIV